MKITTSHDDLKFVEEIVRNVACEYSKALNNNLIFKTKLENLDVSIAPIVIRTAGCTGTIEDGKLDCYMKIFVHSGDSKEFVTFVVAHEFAHLLMINFNDVLRLTNRSTDGSTSYTAVTRIMGNGKIYGGAFEEAISDCLAMYIIAKIYGEAGVEHVKGILSESEESRMQIVDNFASIFGVSLGECEHIDEYTLNENGGYITNIFWYKLVTFDFATIVNIYNHFMGDDEAFQKLIKIFDQYAEEEEKEAYEELCNLIVKFEEKF